MRPVAPVRDPQEQARCLERVGAGDREAFAILYDEFSGLVYSLALRMLRTPAAAEDATQDIWVKIWNAAATYDARRAAVSTWIVVITRRHVLDLLRREKVRAAGRPGIDPQDDADALAISAPDDVAQAAELQELGAEVRTALAQLPHEQRRALVLAYHGGYTQREIADELQKPLGTVKTYMFQGMRTMRTLLDDPHAA
jgi:RNA polymerase sigma-70 factor (ECF subfamily)